MKKAIVLGLMAAVTAVAQAAPAAGQSPLMISIAGGPSFPVGDLAETVETGYHVQGSAGFSIPLFPVALRADLLWQEFPDDGEWSLRQIGGFVNGSIGIPMMIVRPYVIGGVGLVNNDLGEDVTPSDEESETEFGWAAGGGIDFGFVGLTGFLEARYMGAGAGRQAVPVSVGIRF